LADSSESLGAGLRPWGGIRGGRGQSLSESVNDSLRSEQASAGDLGGRQPGRDQRRHQRWPRSPPVIHSRPSRRWPSPTA